MGGQISRQPPDRASHAPPSETPKKFVSCVPPVALRPSAFSDITYMKQASGSGPSKKFFAAAGAVGARQDYGALHQHDRKQTPSASEPNPERVRANPVARTLPPSARMASAKTINNNVALGMEGHMTSNGGSRRWIGRCDEGAIYPGGVVPLKIYDRPVPVVDDRSPLRLRALRQREKVFGVRLSIRRSSWGDRHYRFPRPPPAYRAHARFRRPIIRVVWAVPSRTTPAPAAAAAVAPGRLRLLPVSRRCASRRGGSCRGGAAPSAALLEGAEVVPHRRAPRRNACGQRVHGAAPCRMRQVTPQIGCHDPCRHAD